MIRLRNTASAVLKVGLSAAALFILSPVLAAEDDGVFAYDDAILQVSFYDNSPYAQVSRIRNIPLLTLADSGKSRWFVGINSDGIFGLHYRARAAHRRDTDPIRLHFLDKTLTLDSF